MKRVLVIGASGVFGERLARHLARHRADRFELLLSARDVARVAPLAAELGATAVALDTRLNLADRLTELRPWAVVDCSGPFQGAGHATARAILASGAHAIDLADARDYLAEYRDTLDAMADENGVSGMAGASSTPALSGAVVAHLTGEWHAVDDIEIAIVPGGRGRVGRSVLDAVMSYAGRPVPVWANGRVSQAIGWRDGREIDVPGLGRRRVANVETLDAQRLGERHDVRGSVRFAAGLESTLEQRGIETLAGLRAVGMPLPRWLTPVLHAARDITRLTTGDRGAMVVDVRGRRDDKPTRVRWTLLAENGDGPQVPVLAAAAALSALADGAIEPGADIADLSLGRILAEAEPYAISTRTD